MSGNNEVKTEEIIQEPTDAQVDAWKQAYGDIYMVEIAGKSYYYRPLTRAEFRLMMKTFSNPATVNSPDLNLDIEETTISTAVLHPSINKQNVGRINAGVIGSLSNLIMEASGFEELATPTKL